MDDLISRQAVKELAHNQVREKYCGMAFKKQRDFYIKLADSIIDLLPSIQPKRGRWIEIINSRGVVVALRCSRCEKSPRHGVRSDFCPNCGADMREVTT